MSNFLLMGVEEGTEIFRDLQKVLSKNKKAKLIPLSKYIRSEEELIKTELKKSRRTKTLDFEPGIDLVKKIITANGGKV